MQLNFWRFKGQPRGIASGKIQPEPLRNADVDFIARRDRMQANGDDATGNCINLGVARGYKDFDGNLDRVRRMGATQ